ncbi:MAG: GrpB family protein [Burkholderiaceae bacterium]
MLVPYNSAWPALFEAERVLLEAVLGQWLSGAVEHIGSTAVPGLAAKPVIDIMAPVRALEESRAAIAALREAGYVYDPYKAEVMHWFCKPSPSHRTHHLHLVPRSSALWFERLEFRDALRRCQALASEYCALKADLAANFGRDREGYTQAKAPFVLRVLSQIKRSNST